nr:hypothetical protein [Tanacetum cinerariifolium]
MVELAKLKLDLVEKPVDHTDYRSMIGSLMYVTSSTPDIMFATYMCARYHANPNEHHVSAIKRIFHYPKGTINLGFRYPKNSGFDLTAYSDADHAGCHLDRKSTSGSVQFLVDEPLVVELKALPPHLQYAFLEGDDKLPVIIAKDLSVEEKTALITVLKSHKRAIAWKLSDIKGINPEFCTHKILMEEEFTPAV